MTMREPKYEDLDVALVKATHPGQPTPGDAEEQSGVSPQFRVVDTPQPTVKSDVEERQAVEVRPMRYVLGIGIALAIVAMIAAWMFMR